jgi:hypothetical protein
MEEEKQAEEVEKKDDEKVKVFDITEEGAAQTKEMRFTKRFRLRIQHDDGEIQEGEFTIKRTTIGEQARIGVIMAELREDKPANSIDRNTFALHEWMATVQVVVMKAPPWWKPEDMFDAEPVRKVYLEALRFQNSFRKGSVV